jgi:5-hydroxyisourate hydrolase
MPTGRATARVEALSNHLSTSASPSGVTTAMATEKKPPITCHVLDTTLGRPAANIPVTLTFHNAPQASSSLHFSATTNGDGRVTSWKNATAFSTETVEDVFRQEGDQKYSLTFNTEAYFSERSIRTFFPEVEVKFLVRQEAKGEHYHVPVLLGPFGYTTYRGS